MTSHPSNEAKEMDANKKIWFHKNKKKIPNGHEFMCWCCVCDEKCSGIQYENLLIVLQYLNSKALSFSGMSISMSMRCPHSMLFLNFPVSVVTKNTRYCVDL